MPELDEEDQASLFALRERAAADPLDTRNKPNLTRRAERQQHLQRIERLSVKLPPNWIITYRIETGHDDPGAETKRHLTVTSWKRGELPRREFLWEIATELGFHGELDDCAFWVEGPSGSVHVMQALSTHLPEAYV